jgi:hypothetical protein
MKKNVCGTCFYFESIGDDGECYRNPPVNDGKADTTCDTGGIVKPYRRACGEYKPNLPELKAKPQ